MTGPEPAAFQFMAAHLQKSTGIFSLLFSCIYIHRTSKELLIISTLIIYNTKTNSLLLMLVETFRGDRKDAPNC